MIRKVLLGCGIVSSVLYVASDVVASLRYEGYRYADQTFSELLADGAPTRPLMIALGCIAYGLLVAAFGAGVWATGSTRTARITGALLVGYAIIGTAGGWLFRMNTREVLAAGEGDPRSAMHAPATAVMSVFILLAMGFGAGLFGGRFRWYSYGTIVTLLLFGGLVSLQAGRMVANAPTPWIGIEERVNIYATMLWVAALAGGLWRFRGSTAPRRLGKPAATPRLLPR
jgi:hypothetical protein